MRPPPVLISVAPNGARRTRSDHAALPITAEEIAVEAEACRAAGAGMLHLHVRDAEGSHSLDPSCYRNTIAAVRDRLRGDMLIQITTEACGVFDVAAQMACVRETVPDAASFAVREFFPEGTRSVAVCAFFRWIAERGLIPQFIVYSPAEIPLLHALIDDGSLPFAAPAVLFVLGRYSDSPASAPRSIMAFADEWKARGHWSVCAFGPAERAVAVTAMALGGHPRVGFENNLWRPDGSLLGSTAEQVASLATVARSLERPLAVEMP